tara:strand:- start:218 stop:448 length:231 start_codon:yes stop_codon:yes gene_type:complete
MQLDKSFLIFICFIVVILKFCCRFVRNKNKETMNKVLKSGNSYIVVTSFGDLISKRYKTEKAAIKQLNKINEMAGI